MGFRGAGYLGSDTVLTSTAGQEIIPPPRDSLDTGYQLYKFEFVNIDKPCQVRINNKTTQHLLAGQGWKMDIQDKQITSFKILTSGVQFIWSGAY